MNTGSDSHSSDLDSWRSRSATDGLKNGDASSSSLAAKGFRSVRPNLQDKKSPTQEINPLPLPPPRRDSFHFSPTGTNPPDYSSLIALANDLSPGMQTFSKNDKAVLKESYTVKSTSSYSYSETSANQVRQLNQSTAPNDISNLNASANTNTQLRKVSSLKLTPVTIPDPPAHLNSYADPQLKTQNKASPPPTALPPQSSPILPQPPTQTASLSVHLGTENQKKTARVEPKLPDQTPNQTPTPAPTQVEKPPPAIPPRPSPAELLVHY